MNRRELLESILGTAAGWGLPSHLGAQDKPDNLLLWYRQPARAWMEALPLGNGRLGAMVYGGVQKERLQLNEDTLWSGPPPRDWNNPEAKRYLPEVRRLLMHEGKYAEANELTKKIQGPFNESYQPLGYLNLEFAGMENPSEYRRELNLDTAVLRVSWVSRGAQYNREIFCSAPDQVLVMRIGCDQPGRLAFTASFDSLLRAASRAVAQDGIALRGRAPRHVEPDYIQYKKETVIYEPEPDAKSMRFEAQIKVLAEGGKVEASEGKLRVNGANSVTILLAAGTGYRGFRIPPDLAADQLTEKCRKQLRSAAAKPYGRLLADHVADYQKIFRRISLSLGAAPAPSIPTDERLALIKKNEPDPQFAALYCQYARYLLIASSRPGAQPANLQGIWSEEVRPPWSANWTININTQMNYWHAENGNLPECHAPLFDLIAELAENGKDTARIYYGLDGWVAHHNADLWAQAPPVGESGPNGNPRWSNWPMGGAWLCEHLWEHYAFTLDREFLRRRAYPLMKGAAEFTLGWLIEDGKGRLVTCPSTSPENEFTSPEGKMVAVSVAATMDMAIIWELFTNVMEASRILGVEAEFRARLEVARSRLLPYQIGKFGQLQEWSQDYPEAMRTGHVSHLYPLYPGYQITLRNNPKLARAVRVSLERRIESGTNNGHWPSSWYINLWARLEDADQAVASMDALFRKSTMPNLFNGTYKLFQIDANFGAGAGILEMLLQSHEAVHFLPALPAIWPDGEFRGLRARGGLEVDLAWKGGKATKATVRPWADGEFRFRAPRSQRVSTIRANGQQLRLSQTGEGTTTAKLTKGRTYELSFA